MREEAEDRWAAPGDRRRTRQKHQKDACVSTKLRLWLRAGTGETVVQPRRRTKKSSRRGA